MKKHAFILLLGLVSFLTGCTDNVPTQEDLIPTNYNLEELTADGTLYTINAFMDQFMTESGNFLTDSTPYRVRANNGKNSIYVFSIDTIPSAGPGIYIQGRVITDDYGGNFYKSLIIQEVVNCEQRL
mgnify:CR=1 FL=1